MYRLQKLFAQSLSLTHTLYTHTHTHTHTHIHMHTHTRTQTHTHTHTGDRLKSTDERNDMIVDCLVGLGRLDEAAKKLAEMIIAKPDQWSYIKTYIKCQIQRCQNFRERVRQQVARDRESRQEEEEEEEGEESEGKGDAVESSEGGKRKENGSTEKKEDSHQRAGEQKELKVKEGGTEVSATDVAVTTSGGDGEGRDENASKAGEGGGEEEGRAEDSTEESNEVVVR